MTPHIHIGVPEFLSFLAMLLIANFFTRVTAGVLAKRDGLAGTFGKGLGAIA